jgi:tRNA 2-thiouridine synthesizing protein B
MIIGFIVTKTPQEEGFNNFIKLLKLYMDHDSIHVYLIGNGVYGATSGHVHSDLIHYIGEKYEINVSKNDLNARGIKKNDLILGIKIFDGYGNVVGDLMEKIDHVISF